MKRILLLIAAAGIAASALAQQTPTQVAQADAVKKYPDLAKAGSSFNLEFIARVKRYRTEKADFFQDLTWPLKLAEEIAVTPGMLTSGTKSDSIKPLWMFPTTQFGDSTKFARFITSTKAGNLVFWLSNPGEDLGIAVALVDGMTGKVIQKSPFAEKTGGVLEWVTSGAIVPDGRVLVCSVSSREEASDKSKRARVHLRVVDPISGKFTIHTQMSYDDPTKDAESGPAVWGGAVCTQVGCFGRRIAVANPYFFAEFDIDTLKLIRSTLVPIEKYPAMQANVLETGAIWLWDMDGREPKHFAADFGEKVREITRAKYKADAAQSKKRNAIAGEVRAIVTNGAVEIEAKDDTQHVTFPKRKLALEITSPVSQAIAYPTTKGCVLMVRCSDDKEYHCALSLPAK